MLKKEAKPFLKWAGGKTQMLPAYHDFYPAALEDGTINKYVEPFIGAGAVLFDLLSKYSFDEVIINDLNKQLVLTYRVIQEDINPLSALLEEWQNQYNLFSNEERQKMYYRQRALFNRYKAIESPSKDERTMTAALLIYLNRTCFNGLYRENRSGDFNVPFNKAKALNFDFDNLRAVNEALQNVKITCSDFQQVSSYIDNQTFVYVDPPYRPLSKTSAFTDYTKSPFNDSEQQRLADWAEEMSQRGAFIMLSNSDPQTVDEEDTFFVDLYDNFELYQVEGKRNINRDSDKRGKIGELLIKNAYPVRQGKFTYGFKPEENNA